MGRAQRTEHLPEELLRRRLPLVRRPTGGGAVLHTTEELTYALALSSAGFPVGVPLREMAGFVHRGLRNGLLEQGLCSPGELRVVQTDAGGPVSLCFSAPVSGDLIYQDRKVAGSALRAWREGLLIQGSIQGLPVMGAVLTEVLTSAVLRSFGENGQAGD